MSQDKKDRFIRIAEQRTQKIIKMIKLLGNCSDKKNYEYTEEDVQKIFKAIEAETKSAKARYNREDSEEFSLR